jgi:hypothetical protein
MCWGKANGVGHMEPATKQDIHDLREFIREREVQSIRWFVGTQITYFAMTLAAVWFMVGHIRIGG